MTRICVFGAGRVGCYVGGRLAAAGADVVLIGREDVRAEVAEHGLHLSDYRGYDETITPEFVPDPQAAAEAGLILVTVKSGATAEAGQQLANVLRPGAVVVSLQNGLSNGEVLGEALLHTSVLRGMVPFNVVRRGPGWYHQGSAGGLEIAESDELAEHLPAFEAAGLPVVQRDDMEGVLAAKLLLNCNNALNALSDLPLKTELSQRDFRRCLALAQHEAMDVMEHAGIRPTRLTLLPPGLMARALSMPDALFSRVAASTLAIDPHARSSMWDDLSEGRPTEVDYINGEIVALAERVDRPAPVNTRLVELIRAAEAGPRRAWTGAELLANLTEAANAGS